LILPKKARSNLGTDAFFKNSEIAGGIKGVKSKIKSKFREISF